ncbi:Vacuolar cation/proton exchanger 5 [Diplonema papillatum]|nr:Vacuolar cation/proton exchanger 5 [Diplonema papillatum]
MATGAVAAEGRIRRMQRPAARAASLGASTSLQQMEVSKALIGHHKIEVEHRSRGFREVLFGSKINLGLAALPFVLGGKALGLSDGSVFLLAMVAIVPCAERLGFVTEQLSEHTSDTVGGLLNATFGNATEVLVALFALKGKLYRVVQLSLLGSILSNLLLVLGVACFVGGLRWKIQTFKVVSGAVPSAMLLIAVIGTLLPAALKMSGQEDDRSDEVNFSRFVAIVLLTMYGAFLVFQLRTHSEEFEGANEVTEYPSALRKDDEDPSFASSEAPAVFVPNLLNTSYSQHDASAASYEAIIVEPSCPPTPTAEPPVLNMWESIGWLAFITVVISLISEVIVSTIEGFTKQYNVNSVFTSAVIIPVFGNAAEHAAAILFAYRNRMDICMGIAVGSSTQIALCLLPICVLVGWFIDRPLTLFFNGFETASLMASVIIVTAILQNGTSNWLMGFLLVGAYLVIACGFWVHELENLSAVKGLPEGRITIAETMLVQEDKTL